MKIMQIIQTPMTHIFKNALYYVIHNYDECEQHITDTYTILSPTPGSKSHKICYARVHKTYNFKIANDRVVTFHDDQGKDQGMINISDIINTCGFDVKNRPRLCEYLNKFLDPRAKFHVNAVITYYCPGRGKSVGFELSLGDKKYFKRICDNNFGSVFDEHEIIDILKIQCGNNNPWSRYDLSDVDRITSDVPVKKTCVFM